MHLYRLKTHFEMKFRIFSRTLRLTKSFDYVTGLKNSSFNAIKVFKANVTQSQHKGKDNTKIFPMGCWTYSTKGSYAIVYK